MSFDDDLDAQSRVMATDRDWADAEVTVNKKLQRFRFSQMDGLEWADLTDQCPPRPTSPIDRKYGYNFRAVAVLAAPKSGKRFDGNDLVDMTDDQWQKLLRNLPGLGLRIISDVIFSLNEWIPALEVVEAKKAFAVESDKSLSSPAVSASPAAD